jgi:acyl transferase domain-containing protein
MLCYGIGMRRRAHAAARAALSLEAERMDPQQRVALEVSLDALVGAGLVRAGGSGRVGSGRVGSGRARRAATDQAPRRLRGSYDARLVGYGGTAGGILCHRAAPYLLGLTGPSL